MGKAEKHNFYVAIVLYGKEMKWTLLHMNARGEGHNDLRQGHLS